LRGGVYRMLKDVQHKCGPAWETNPLQWYSSAPNQDRHKFIRKSTRGGFQHLFGRQLPGLPRKVFISHNKVFLSDINDTELFFSQRTSLSWSDTRAACHRLLKTPKIFMWLSTLVPYIRSNENLGSSSEGSGLAALIFDEIFKVFRLREGWSATQHCHSSSDTSVNLDIPHKCDLLNRV
jgi:hypothetical protein